MNNYIYIVMKTGVYKQAILGVFLLEKDAWEIAEKFIESEYDSYHIAEIYKCNLNKFYSKDLEDNEKCIGYVQKKLKGEGTSEEREITKVIHEEKTI